MGNNPVGKKVNTPKVNTWENTFLRKYPGCLKVNTFLLLALGFYLNPTPGVRGGCSNKRRGRLSA